ncbi:hypothetical protein HZY97_11345 [Sphingomonas sp. R-74633]|nr:hypothetical protein [Sphingomonas sp. R-74633]
MLLLALAAASPLPQQLSDGDAIVAIAWERRLKDNVPAENACVKADGETVADDIRKPGLMFRDMIAKDDDNQRPNPARLRRIAKGEGTTLAFDLKRLELPSESPACKYHYFVAAPVKLGDYAYVHVGMICGGLCGHGEILLLERRDGAWRVVEPVVEWDS